MFQNLAHKLYHEKIQSKGKHQCIYTFVFFPLHFKFILLFRQHIIHTFMQTLPQSTYFYSHSFLYKTISNQTAVEGVMLWLPDPGMILMTPLGMPALTDSSANFSAVRGVTWMKRCMKNIYLVCWLVWKRRYIKLYIKSVSSLVVWPFPTTSPFSPMAQDNSCNITRQH